MMMFTAPVATATLALALAACTGGDEPGTYPFGPFEIAAHEESTSQCVQISLNNPEATYISSVELTTGPGFHHSNWLFVPEHVFPGEDGTYTCSERNFDQAVAAIFGGVLFAQSTQVAHEVQQFPPGVVVTDFSAIGTSAIDGLTSIGASLAFKRWIWVTSLCCGGILIATPGGNAWTSCGAWVDCANSTPPNTAAVASL